MGGLARQKQIYSPLDYYYIPVSQNQSFEDALGLRRSSGLMRSLTSIIPRLFI